jgi:hypothetical protein
MTRASWGYLVERGRSLKMDLCNLLSRVLNDNEYRPARKPPSTNKDRTAANFSSVMRTEPMDTEPMDNKQDDEEVAEHEDGDGDDGELGAWNVRGRIQLNLWKIARKELTLNMCVLCVVGYGFFSRAFKGTRTRQWCTMFCISAVHILPNMYCTHGMRMMAAVSAGGLCGTICTRPKVFCICCTSLTFCLKPASLRVFMAFCLRKSCPVVCVAVYV